MMKQHIAKTPVDHFFNVLKTDTDCGLPSLTTFVILQCKKKKDKDTADQTENHKQIATKKKLNSNAHHLPDCNRQTSEKKTSQS